VLNKGAVSGKSSVSSQTRKADAKKTIKKSCTQKCSKNPGQKGKIRTRAQKSAGSRIESSSSNQSFEQSGFQESLPQGDCLENDLSFDETSAQFEDRHVEIERLSPQNRDAVIAFIRKRSHTDLPAPLAYWIEHLSSPIFAAKYKGIYVGFIALWADNLGSESSLLLTYWLTENEDKALRKWIDADLLEAVRSYAVTHRIKYVYARIHEDDEARREALASLLFEPVDEILTMRCNVSHLQPALSHFLRTLSDLSFECVDLKEIADLHHRAYFDDPLATRINKNTLPYALDPDAEIWKVIWRGQAVGYVELALRSIVISVAGGSVIRVGVIESLALVPEFRNQGLSESLLLWAVHRLEQKKAKNIRLKVKNSNIPAVKVYKKIGFSVVETHAIWVLKTAF